jgi:hypothetical protein
MLLTHVNRATGSRCSLVSLHGSDSALVVDERGIASFALLRDLEAAAATVEHAGRPDNPKRFDRWTDPEGQVWIFDQPRSTDGSYLADDPDTDEVESRLRWYRCSGNQQVTADCRAPERGVDD